MIKAKEIDGELWVKASDHHQAIKEALAQEQEPVACIVKGCINDKSQGRFVGDLCSPCHEYITKAEGRHSQAYRNTQRTWVGLDEVEIVGCTCECIDVGEFNMSCAIDFARAIEAKLKQKNGYAEEKNT